MDVSLEWFYMVLTVPFIVVWGALWWYASHTRREQVRISVVFALVGIVVENVFYFKDYWHPASVFPIDVGVFIVYPEFLLFGGAFGGIATVVYRGLFGIREESHDVHGAIRRGLIAGALFLIPSVLLVALGVNSIYATAGGALLLAIYISLVRPDVRRLVLANGILTLGIMFVCYTFVLILVSNVESLLSIMWYLYNTPLDVRVSGIPFTELVWGFAVGALAGVIRAYVKNICYAEPRL